MFASLVNDFSGWWTGFHSVLTENESFYLIYGNFRMLGVSSKIRYKTVVVGVL